MTPDGAVDNDYDAAEKPPAERLAESFKDATDGVPTHRDLGAGDVALDLVTQQLLYVRDIAAESCVEFYADDGMDLPGYDMHPWLPVRSDDKVLSCVYIGDVGAQSLHKGGREYSFPAGRLARVPVELFG